MQDIKDIQDIEILRKILGGFKEHWINRAMVATGVKKLRYKSHIKPQDVRALRAQGLTISQIAKALDIGVSTVKRRLKEVDKA